VKQTLIAAAIASTISIPVHSSESAGLALEEIVVTAQRRDQSVNDIGVSVTAFASDDVRELGFEAPKDLAANTPGLSTVNATSGGTPIFAIRGVGLDDFNSNNSSGVGVYVDEVIAAYPVFLNGQLFDIERVEVLKGPQGTLYGKNTTGGAINFVSIKPSDDFEAYVTAGLSRWNSYELEGAVNVSVSDSVNSRVAVKAEYGDGWQNDINTDEEFGSTDQFAVRSLTSVELGDDADLLLALRYSKDEGTPISPQNTSADEVWFTPQGTLGSSDDPSKVNVGALDVSRDEEGRGASATLSIDFDAFSLTSITAVDQYSRDVTDNYDGQSLSTADSVYDEEFDVFSQEVRFTSTAEDGFSWIAGLVYSDEKVSANNTVDLTDLIAFGVTFPPPFGFGIPVVVDSATTSVNFQQDTRSFGAYLHTETELNESWMLTAGLRFSYDRREFKGHSVDNEGWFRSYEHLNLDLAADLTDDGLANGSVPIGYTPPVSGEVGGIVDDSQTERNWSGKLGLDYTLNEDWLFYGSIASSYKGGIFYGAPAGSQEVVAYVDPETVLAYELGRHAGRCHAVERRCLSVSIQ